MWQIQLRISHYQLLLISSFFLLLWLGFFGLLLFEPYVNLLFIVAGILGYEWFKAYRYCQQLIGEFALFYHVGQLYWQRQRWTIVGRPLLLRYAVFIRLRSLRSGQISTLFLVSTNMHRHEWRSLCYYLNGLAD